VRPALPEQAFYMVGAIEEAFEKARPCSNGGCHHPTSTSSARRADLLGAKPSSSCFQAKRASFAIYPRHTRSFTRIQARRGAHYARGRRRGAVIFVAGGNLEVQPKVDHCPRRHRDTVAVDLDEGQGVGSARRAEEAMRKIEDKQEIATLQAEFAMMAAATRCQFAS